MNTKIKFFKIYLYLFLDLVTRSFYSFKQELQDNPDHLFFTRRYKPIILLRYHDGRSLQLLNLNLNLSLSQNNLPEDYHVLRTMMITGTREMMVSGIMNTTMSLRKDSTMKRSLRRKDILNLILLL